LVPGASVRLEPSRSALRKTAFSLRVVEYEGVWVSIDAQVPNKLIRKALANRILQPFQDLEFVRSEPAYKNGRFDFMLTEQTGRKVYLEVKSVTLVERECGFFPDAPTERGRRHLQHLADLVQAGSRCAVVFVIQRHDVKWFQPNYRTDPAFAEALRQAVSCGVEVYAYRCHVSPAGISLGERLPVLV
jgi:sugar fermentation stimulation protein A